MANIWLIISACLVSAVLTAVLFIPSKTDKELKELRIELDKLQEQNDALVKFNKILIDDNVQMTNELARIEQKNKKNKKIKKQSQSVDKE